MRLLFVRHGETDWNLEKRYQGRSDLSLNETGRRQAAEVAEKLLNNSVRSIYSSTLARAKETADIIGERLNLPVYEDERLVELDFGRWEGLTFTEIYDAYRQEFSDWYESPFHVTTPDGESLSQLLNRVLPAVQALNQRHSGHPSDTVVIVTHGAVIKALLAHFTPGYDVWEEHIGHCSVTVLEI